MKARLCELRNQEVINVCDGCRVGFVEDVEVDCVCGKIIAIIVPGKCRCFGLLGREDDFVIPWNCIRRIGNDIILVEVDLSSCRKPCRKRSFF